MAESAAEAKPNQMFPLADPPPSSTTPTSSSSSIITDTDTRDGRSGWMGLWNNRGHPSLRVTTEFDSESSVFSHRASFKLLKDGLAKLKLSFLNLPNGHLSDPHLSFVSNLFSLHYDLHDHNALLTTSFPLGPYLRVSASHDLKARQGELSMVANLAHPAYALELSYPLPAVAMPRATLKFPLGEISLQEEEELQEEQVKTPLSLSGFVKSHMLNGLCTAQYSDHDFTLRYSYKDEALSFIPAISLPSNALSFAFKRRFNPCNKLSYWYNFDANTWSAVYKNTYGNDFKFKAGYDSAVRLGWASLWVGDESGKAKTAPMKMKVQFMLQVPQDDIRSSALMFRVKKRWDIW